MDELAAGEFDSRFANMLIIMKWIFFVATVIFILMVVMPMMLSHLFRVVLMRRKIMCQQNRIGGCKEKKYDTFFEHGMPKIIIIYGRLPLLIFGRAEPGSKLSTKDLLPLVAVAKISEAKRPARLPFRAYGFGLCVGGLLKP
jgi:hypothetical protein